MAACRRAVEGGGGCQDKLAEYTFGVVDLAPHLSN